MSNETIMIHDASTDEIVVRELTDAEQKLRDAETLAWENAKAQAEAEAAAKKAAAEAKLAALGLTADDLKALGLGGN
jgi:adenylate kinase